MIVYVQVRCKCGNRFKMRQEVHGDWDSPDEPKPISECFKCSNLVPVVEFMERA